MDESEAQAEAERLMFGMTTEQRATFLNRLIVGDPVRACLVAREIARGKE